MDFRSGFESVRYLVRTRKRYGTWYGIRYEKNRSGILFQYGTWYGPKFLKIEKIKGPFPIFFTFEIRTKSVSVRIIFVPSSGPSSVPTNMRTKIRTTYRSVPICTDGTDVHYWSLIGSQFWPIIFRLTKWLGHQVAGLYLQGQWDCIELTMPLYKLVKVERSEMGFVPRIVMHLKLISRMNYQKFSISIFEPQFAILRWKTWKSELRWILKFRCESWISWNSP